MIDRDTQHVLLGVFPEPETATEGVVALREAGFEDGDFDVVTGEAFPEGTLGKPVIQHRLFTFPFIGAAMGFSIAILVTVGTQISYPLVTGGKPIISIPPSINVIYEGTLLGAVLFTVIGILFESRLPWIAPEIIDPRINDEGYVGIMVFSPEDRLADAETLLRRAGAVDVFLRERGRTVRWA